MIHAPLCLLIAALVAAPTAARPPETLELVEVLERVERNYPKLLGAELKRQVAGAKFLEKQGAFDPTLAFKSEALEFVDGVDEVTKRKDQVLIEVPTRSGIRLFGGTRASETTVEGKAGTKEFDKAFLGIKVPLIRDARLNAKLAAERQARLGRPLAEAEQRAVRLEILQKAGEVYWEWVGAVMGRSVAEEMVELARLRAMAIAEQVRRGDKPELVSIEAEREVQKRLGLLAKADRNLQKAELKLSLFLWSDEGVPEDPPRPEAAPRAFPAPVILDDEAVAEAERLALAQRPELEAVELQGRIRGIDLGLARNDGRPDLQLFLNSGRETDLDVFEPIERRLRAGVKLSIPLGTRSPRGRAQAARLDMQRLEMEGALLRQQVRTEVRNAASQIRTDRERYQAAAREVELALRLEQGERTSFEFGDGTLFLVNQRERSRAEAQLQRIEVAADYQQALLGLRAAAGDL